MLDLTRRLTPPTSRLRRDDGQATVEHIGVLALVASIVLAVALAVTANVPLIGDRLSTAICTILTLGTGDCGASEAVDREPNTPCLIDGKGDKISAGVDFTVLGGGAERGFNWEKRSDGTYRVFQTNGLDVGATAGIGASVNFTVADKSFGEGASAEIEGGVGFTSGREWIVGSVEEKDRIVSGEHWDRVGMVVPGVGAYRALGELIGFDDRYPPEDRIFVSVDKHGSASGFAGAGSATATVEGGTSQAIGYSYDRKSGHHTAYFETKIDGEAAAQAAGIPDDVGGGVQGEMKVLTSVTVDSDGNVVSVKRSGLATGEASGLMSWAFGGDPSISTGDKVGKGTQYEAILDVTSDADRQAAMALMASAGINPLGIGVDPLDGYDGVQGLDPFGQDFMDAVRDRGTLTRHTVELDESVWAEGGVDVAAGLKAAISAGYSRNSIKASDHEYWDGRGFAARSNC